MIAIGVCDVQAAHREIVNLQRSYARFANNQAADGKSPHSSSAECQCPDSQCAYRCSARGQ